MSTATSVAGTRGPGQGRRCAGSSRRPAAWPDPAPPGRLILGMPGTPGRPYPPNFRSAGFPMSAGPMITRSAWRLPAMSASHECRLCGTPLTRTFVDLGMSPLCESYIPADRLDDPEVFYPLHVRLCDACLL